VGFVASLSSRRTWHAVRSLPLVADDDIGHGYGYGHGNGYGYGYGFERGGQKVPRPVVSCSQAAKRRRREVSRKAA
jgi:hypothetical protein